MGKQKIFENVWIRALSILCVLALFFTLCYLLKGILISLFLAFTVAYIFDPAVDFISERKVILAKTRVPRGLSVAILLTLVFLVVGGLLTYTVPKTVSGIQRVGVALKEQYPKYQEKVEKIIDEYGDTEVGIFLKSKLQNQPIDDKKIKDGKPQEQEVKEVAAKKSVDTKYGIPDPVLKLKKYVPEAMTFVLGIVKNVFYSTFGFFGIVMNVVVFGVVMVYLLKDFDVAISKGEGLLPVSKKEKISGIISKIDENLKAFFRGQMAVCAILSIIYGIGLTVIGIPMSFLLALVGGFGNMIPYVGIGFGLIPAI
ncbi:MAG: AI-2E family transporter, partial [Candidatus Scalindua sp.]|nr:AI-2E family transporter [Candidatus Scalindua sp.]